MLFCAYMYTCERTYVLRVGLKGFNLFHSLQLPYIPLESGEILPIRSSFDEEIGC